LPGLANCDNSTGGACSVNITSDTQNCGACGNVCEEYPNSSPTCVNSDCGIKCFFRYLNCNDNITDGCETEKSIDNCGGCGVLCNSSYLYPNTEDFCDSNDGKGSINFYCVVSCIDSTEDCDATVFTGCSNPATDDNNCGSCGVVCGPGDECEGGECVSSP